METATVSGDTGKRCQHMGALYAVLAIIVLAGIITAARAIKTVQQYEDGIIFRFGRVLRRRASPGTT